MSSPTTIMEEERMGMFDIHVFLCVYRGVSVSCDPY